MLIARLRERPLTLALIAIWVVLEVLAANTAGYNWLTGQGVLPPLILAGAIDPTRVVAGEWWRLLTSGFLHFGWIHLGLNAFAMYIVGGYVEPRVGPARMLGIFASGLLTGSLLAYASTVGQRTLTAGASGAIMGLFGAMVVIAYPLAAEERALRRAAIPIMVTIANGLGRSGISTAAHVGGLIGGMAVAALLSWRWPSGWMAASRAEQESRAAAAQDSEAERPQRSLDRADFIRETLVLRPGRRRRLAILGLVAVLATSGTLLLMVPFGLLGGDPGELSPAPLLSAWFLLILAAALAFAGRRVPALVLSPSGFTFEAPFSAGRAAWSDIAQFRLVTIGTGFGAQLGVSYLLVPRRAFRRRGWFGSFPDARAKMLPLFGLSAPEQARLLESWRERWSAEGISWPAGTTDPRRTRAIWPVAAVLAAIPVAAIVVLTVRWDTRVHLTAHDLIVEAADITATARVTDRAVASRTWGRDFTGSGEYARATVWVTVFEASSDARDALARATCQTYYTWTDAPRSIAILPAPRVGDRAKACRYVFAAVDQFAVWTVSRNVRIDVAVTPRGAPTDAAGIALAQRLAEAQIARLDRLAPRSGQRSCCPVARSLPVLPGVDPRDQAHRDQVSEGLAP